MHKYSKVIARQWPVGKDTDESPRFTLGVYLSANLFLLDYPPCLSHINNIVRSLLQGMEDTHTQTNHRVSRLVLSRNSSEIDISFRF
jgi:hypothetical protein